MGMNPNAAAVSLSKTLGRKVTAKMVRTVARSVLSDYDKTKHPAYQSHDYDAREYARILAAMRARGSRSVAKPDAPKRAKRAKVAKPAPVAVEA